MYIILTTYIWVQSFVSHLWERKQVNKFENNISKFGSRAEVGEVSGKLCIYDLHNLRFSSGIIKMVKSWLTGWVGYIAHIGEIRKS
jgi:hypothetical protein